ncbi:uncharacterized protein LOC115448773 [Manduca sexta]|uniref:Uncharacterized protein n=1 Tax=Manduca sexta TaxID=7130 RepID=A0A921ZJ07_MANSE|nr:uncharacterized protein LOC115448773 [Manduca sexta]KAG6458363.1 hypothetical protein O3G_MSEX010820 [Manduca sexta]
MIIYIILTLLSPVLCQYPSLAGIKPDVTFGDENERFDISSVIRDQNRYYGDQDFRRAQDRDLLNALKDTFTALRRSNADVKNTVEFVKMSDSDFAYHDTMDSGGGSVADFEMNLKKFKKDADEYRKLKTDQGQDGRRTIPDESEILMNYALPVQLKVKGYLQLPLDK